MTTAIIGTGGLGSVIARVLASGGETLRLANVEKGPAQALATQIGPAAAVAEDNRDALEGADVVILALRFGALEGVIGEISVPLADKLLVVPSNPVTLDAQGKIERILSEGQSSGEVVSGWLSPEAHLAMAFGSLSAPLLESSSNRTPERAVLFYAADDGSAGESVKRLICTAGFEPVKVGGLEQSTRLEVGGDLHDQIVGLMQGQSLIGEV
jgi:8-hydroxy-5-deazaflavin:NADPH oxidoreductase